MTTTTTMAMTATTTLTTSHEGSAPPDVRPRSKASRQGLSVRSRVLAGMLGLITIAFMVTGSVVYVLQLSSMDARIDDSLKRSVEEFRVLAARHSDPTVFPEPVTAEVLLYTAMQQTLPANHEGMLSIVNGKVRWTAPEVVEVRLENDPEFVAWSAGSASHTDVVIQSVPTATTTYRAVSVPVTMSDQAGPAHLIFAYDYTAEKQALNQGFLMYLLVGLVVMVTAGVVGWMLVGRILRPITLLRDTARQISESDLEQRIEVVGRDDLAELTVTVNAMLDRLENAMTSQRQLLDDVGHELRTPVTIIQGHLELMDPLDPGDVNQSRDIALAELDRMSFLINDLVTLAKSNRIDFVQPVATNVGALLDDLLDKAHPLGDRTWKIGHRNEAVAILDPQRITQAMLQLCSNAVKFSTPGTTITLGTNIDGPAGGKRILRFWVRDEGIGIAPEDQERIFERFGRGHNSKRTEGSGLGLNIVAAIAEAHHGTVGVSSDPGIGSTFVMEIPLSAEGEEN